MNVKGGLQKNSTKMYEEEGPKDKKPAIKNRLFERPSLVNLSHVSKLYEESGREDKNNEVNKKGKNKKNTKESSFTNIDDHKEKEQAELLKDEKQKYHHKIPRKKGGNDKLWSPKEWACLTCQVHFYR